MSRRICIFISYAHIDEGHRKRLDVHLAPLKRDDLIEAWHDRMIPAGSLWAEDIDRNLAKADIVLLLISADFVASDYCYEKEMKLALERHHRGEATVIPIIVAPVDFSNTPFARLQALPRDAKPVSTWSNADEAWLDVAKGIRHRVESLRP
jgi:TIR domain-containing protein